MSTFSLISLLVLCDGENNSTNIVDSGPKAKPLTVVGNAKLSTSEAIYGSAALLLDGVGDYITTTSGLEDFRFGTGDYTVAFVFKPTNTAKVHTPLSFYNSTTAGTWLVSVNATGRLEWYIRTTTDVLLLHSGSTSLFTGGGPKHVALCRSSGVLRMFVEGVMIASVSDSTNYNNTSVTELGIGAITFSRGGGFPAQDMQGVLDDIIIAKEALYTSNFTPQHGLTYKLGRISVPHVLGDAQLLAEQTPHSLVDVAGPLQPAALAVAVELRGLVGVPTPLGAAQLLAQLQFLGLCAADSPLGQNTAVALHDFYDFLSEDPRHFYTMQLQPPAGAVRVPISSWQATLNLENASFVQCVVPAADQWVDELGDAESFVIFRRTTLIDGREIEVALASAPLQTLTFAQGGFNSTATLQGYLTGLALDPDAPATPTLRDVQTVFTYADGIRVRCALDWQLRPGMTCYYGSTPIVVEYINYYVTQGQAYMDVGGA